LVEDEPLILLVAQDALEAGGYAVLPATVASEALSLLDNRIEELSGLVTDIRLPGGLDGWEIARHAGRGNSLGLKEEAVRPAAASLNVRRASAYCRQCC
jgi:CheY-like chemotaxis protein